LYISENSKLECSALAATKATYPVRMRDTG
jgi:hypothetical protein